MYIEAYFYSYIQDIVFQFARKLKFIQDNYVINFERNCFDMDTTNANFKHSRCTLILQTCEISC